MRQYIVSISFSMIKYIIFVSAAITSVILFIPDDARAQNKRETPYWASIDKTEARMRTGPSTEYPVKWIYKRKNLPVKVIDTHEDWRKIEDPDGDQGWMHVRLLSSVRTAIVIGNANVKLFDQPSPSGKVAWRAEPGVVGKIDECGNTYCRMDIVGRAGYIDVRYIMGDEQI